MTKETSIAWGKINSVKGKLAVNQVGYDEAVKLVNEYLMVINQAGEKIAKKFKQRYIPIVAAKILR